MAGFEFKYSLSGNPDAWVRQYILKNSVTYTVGDAVVIASGFLDIATAGARLLGVLEGFVDNNGLSLDHKEADFDGTLTSATQTYLTASDNQTDKKVRGLVRVDPYAVYSSTPDATIGTTTGSNLQGYYTDLLDEDQVDESTAATTAAQLWIHGVDPDNSSNGLYSIAEHLFNR